MKHIATRLLALLLACVMVLAVCGCAETAEREKQGGEKQGDEVPEDLGGYEFTVADCSNGRWNKELSGTPNADAWIQVMDEVESLYNCTVSATYVNPSEAFTNIQPELAAGGKYADLIITTQWQYGYFLGAQLMMDLNQLEVDWDREWWNQDVRKMGTYGGKTYIGLGSFIFDTAYTWVLYYNQAVWEEMGFEDPYKLVDERRWTFDLFRDYCQRVSRDQDNSGAMDTYEDRWGMSGSNGDLARAWYFSLGGQYFKTADDGRVSLACNNERTYDIVDKMYTMVKKDHSVYPTNTAGADAETERAEAFARGNLLFYAYLPGTGRLKDMEDDWGVMPFPLYDENQDTYWSGVDHNAPVFGVTANNTDTHEVSVLLDAFGRHAMILEDIFWPDYKETYWRHEEDDTRIMSEYVVGHGKHDLAPIMQNCNNIFRAPMDRVFNTVFGAASADFASWIDSVEGIVNTQLDDYFEYDAAEPEDTAE